MTKQEKFINAFKIVQQNGTYQSVRKGNTGIGATLEKAMGIKENNSELSDLHGFEIKSQRSSSNSHITLFTKAPAAPKRVNNHIRNQYGSPDPEFNDIKILHTSVFGNRWNQHSGGYSYKMECDNNAERIFLLIKDNNTGDIKENNIFWTYDQIKTKLDTKLKNLALIGADSTTVDDNELFTFNSCSLYFNPTIKTFIDGIQNGIIMFDFRIGAYKNKLSKQYGKTHDHGSAFRIKKEHLNSLYTSNLSV